MYRMLATESGVKNQRLESHETLGVNAAAHFFPEFLYIVSDIVIIINHHHRHKP